MSVKLLEEYVITHRIYQLSHLLLEVWNTREKDVLGFRYVLVDPQRPAHANLAYAPRYAVGFKGTLLDFAKAFDEGDDAIFTGHVPLD